MLTVLITFVLEGCQALGLEKDTLPPDPHHHVIDVNSHPVASDLCQDFQIVETSLPSSTPMQLDVVENQSHSLKVLISCNPVPDRPGQCQDRLFIEQAKTDKQYELQTACFLLWRPFSDFVWVTDNILVFDQWANPHIGHHYVVDMEKKKLIGNSAFPDEVPIDNQKSK